MLPRMGREAAVAHVNRIACAVPPFDVHAAFERFVGGLLKGRREEALFRRMAGRSGIERRFSSFEPVEDPDGFVADREGFYAPGAFPPTSRRMARYAEVAPELAAEAIGGLRADLSGVTHLVLASCTGFMAPGLDQVLVRRLGLDPGVERTVVGYMGCYAAVNSLRLAHHIVRSDPGARVLVVTIELCTLHFQDTLDVEKLLSMLLFGDGCAAALVTADEEGVALDGFRSFALPESGELITWDIGDHGFDMHLSGQVPQRIRGAMADERARNAADGVLRGRQPEDYRLFAVHAGGKAILDAVETGLGLAEGRLDWSRGVLRDFGNMSSATLMFVLQRILADAAPGNGLALAFGPGLACETFAFRKL
ncbi:type III polyketide synthase [Sandaracinobacter sp. RS1-74]|nr:type III polyketide synthase [Sandaracinobacteroides sayramensis]